ncbi:enoyl-CoA hydratase/isomerase family protein [Bosea sp. TAB14]|uniref:enoyl-CoA hydratase/isomerase family protein n=1 Tax=Bosea sp. TAB14 TaxID=3237481 RepID=UPI003F92A499
MSQALLPPADVIVQVQDRIGVVMLNRPDRLNSFTSAARSALIASLKALDSDDGVDAIIIRGADVTAFSSGQNLDEASTVRLDGIAAWQQHQRAMYQALRDLAKPSVAAIDGICVGGGMHVALCADWRVATPKSKWGQPEVRVGVASIVGPYLIGLHVGRTHTVQLSLSGELINGQRAYEIGLATELAEPDVLLERAVERAKLLGSLPRSAVRLTKKRFRDTTQADFDEVCSAGIEAQMECYAQGEPQAMMGRFLARREAKRVSEAG